MERDIYSRLPAALLPWYETNKRELPWRRDRDPYHIWISEVMLQQTRVEAVKEYYARFLDAIPNVIALAQVDDELLHKLWEGLGYYSRVRNLKKAAQVIVEEHGGIFPQDYKAVRALPGIGPYTAGAICSIAFGQPVPAVDGNVLRVIARLTDDCTPVDTPAWKKAVEENLRSVYPKEASSFTQALMELGATVCGPNREPDCEGCPCSGFCFARKKGTALQLPVKTPKRQRRTEELTVLILSCDGLYALEKRPGKGLLAGLWQFPNLPGRLSGQETLDRVEELGMHPRRLLRSVERKHIFTHVQWDMVGFYIEVSNTDHTHTWLSPRQIREEAALPTAFRQFWEGINKIAGA